LALLLHSLRIESLDPFRSDRVDDLPVFSPVTIPPEMSGQIVRCFRLPGADDEPQPSPIQLSEILRRPHPGVSGDDHVSDTVSVLEGFDHGNDRVGLCFRSLEATDLEWEPCPIDKEAHNDLRIHTTFFRVSDLPQIVLFLGFKI